MEKDMFTTLGISVCLFYWYKRTNTDAEGVALDQYQREAQYRIYKGKEQPVKVFTCTVGGQPSFAAYCLYSLDDVVSSSVCVSLFFLCLPACPPARRFISMCFFFMFYRCSALMVCESECVSVSVSACVCACVSCAVCVCVCVCVCASSIDD